MPGCDSAGAAERSYPTSKVRGTGREELPHVQRAASAQEQEGQDELLHVQGQEGGPQEQWLRLARAGVKRYPTPNVRETQVTQRGHQRGIRGKTH